MESSRTGGPPTERESWTGAPVTTFRGRANEVAKLDGGEGGESTMTRAEAARPPIPEDVKRQVRQRCAFGCVICGLPVYHYDHMTAYHVVKEHDAANITLLCASHHDQRPVGG